jgi:hypothetical protein
MSYEILGKSGNYWTCPQCSWQHYLRIATAFGWAPDGAFFKNDEGGFGPHPSGSYLGNDWQLVTDEDARAFSAALNLAIDAVNAGSPLTADQADALKNMLTADQADALKNIEVTSNDRYADFDPNEQSCVASLSTIADLAEVAALGGFTIA